MQKKKVIEDDEELKHSEELNLIDAEKKSKIISKSESQCIIYRLKLFAHLIVKKQNGKAPVNLLIEISQRVISDSDQILLN